MITFIVPTRNRLNHVKRTLKYVSHLPYQFIFADNSTLYNSLPKDIQLSKNVEYLFLENSTFSNKVNTALSKVTTKYVAMMADDDFFTLSGIKTCIDFLEKNETHSAVHGYTLGFFEAKNKVGFEKMYHHENNVNCKNDDVVKRTTEMFSPYMPLFYSIHRTENFRKIFATELLPENLNFVEFKIALYAAVKGKFEVLPVLLHIREEALFSAGFTTKAIADMPDDEEWNIKLNSFKNYVANDIATLYKVSHSIASTIAESSISSYINWVKSLPISNNKMSYAYLKKKYLKPYFPALFSWLVKQKKATEINHQQINHVNLSNYSNADILKAELMLIESVILNIS
jgi:glycosyltransferase domain-containing protein